jgi:predicted RNase H-like HicB family nuclease
MLRYAIVLAPDDNDTLLVTCPAFPELTAFGANEADAKQRAVDAIEEAIEAGIDAECLATLIPNLGGYRNASADDRRQPYSRNEARRTPESAFGRTGARVTALPRCLLRQRKGPIGHSRRMHRVGGRASQ